MTTNARPGGDPTMAPDRAVPRILVVGGGFAGAAFATHLFRDHPDAAFAVEIVEARATLGAGLAYDTADPVHRVNVAASRLSLFAERPDDFVDWLRRDPSDAEDPDSAMPGGGRYPRRAVFGRYAASSLRDAAGRARGSLRHVRGRAVAASRHPSGGYAVRLADGRALECDLLLLATGHPPPATLAPFAALPPDRLIADPWAPDALAAVDPARDVLVVGTGLTACDVIASLRARGHRGRILAVSRRGLLPRPRTTLPVSAYGDFATAPAATARALLRRARAAVAEAALAGRPWEDVIDALRRDAPVAWNALDLAEQRRLLRHLRPYWDAHRFQSAPQIDRALDAARRDGALVVRAASLVAARAEGERVAVTLRPRAAPDAPDTVLVGTVIDCTGPGHRSVVDTSPVLRSLAEAGLIQADATRLGLATDRQSRALDRQGVAARDLFVLGPLARAAHGELMGLPQVSTQPRAVAGLVARMEEGQASGPDDPLS